MSSYKEQFKSVRALSSQPPCNLVAATGRRPKPGAKSSQTRLKLLASGSNDLPICSKPEPTIFVELETVAWNEDKCCLWEGFSKPLVKVMDWDFEGEPFQWADRNMDPQTADLAGLLKNTVALQEIGLGVWYCFKENMKACKGLAESPFFAQANQNWLPWLSSLGVFKVFNGNQWRFFQP